MEALFTIFYLLLGIGTIIAGFLAARDGDPGAWVLVATGGFLVLGIYAFGGFSHVKDFLQRLRCYFWE